MTSLVVQRKAAAIVLIAFVITGFVGVTHLGMSMGNTGVLETCPFMNTALCTMDAAGHLGEWQTMLATPLQDLYAAAILLLLIAGAAPPLLRARFESFAERLRMRFRQAVAAHTQLFLEAPRILQESFSQGILHTRAY